MPPPTSNVQARAARTIGLDSDLLVPDSTAAPGPRPGAGRSRRLGRTWSVWSRGRGPRVTCDNGGCVGGRGCPSTRGGTYRAMPLLPAVLIQAAGS
eukprot:1592807-Rhodomonas_salina.1